MCLFAAVVLFPFVGAAQTITLQRGLTTYSTLTNGSVITLSNRCELHVTATTTPISGCLATRILWDGGTAYQRIFDFGNSTTQYMFLTPR